MSDRKHEQPAKDFCDAIRAFADKPDNLDNFESYLSIHFAEWLKKYASTPEKISKEMLNFANIESRSPRIIKLKLERVSNMVFICRNDNVIKAWEIDSFTKRKLKNFIKKYEEFNPDSIIKLERDL